MTTGAVDSAGGPPGAPRGRSRPLPWESGQWETRPARIFTYGLVGFQLLQGFVVQPALTGFSTSYWMVTYDEGFIRRGLAGTVLQRVSGPLSAGAIEVAAWALALVAIGSCLLLVEALLRRRTAATTATAILVASSPFTFDYFVDQRRPDLLAVPILVGLGFVLTRPTRRPEVWCAAVGLALAVAVLAHEGTALYSVPWAVVMVAVIAGTPALRPLGWSRSRGLVSLAALTIPPGLAAALVLIHLDASTPAVSAALLAKNPWFHDRSDHTMFVYLGDSFSSTVEKVLQFPTDKKAPSFVFGTALVAAQAVWLARWCRHRLDSCLRAVRPRLFGVLSALGLLGGTVLLFLSGLDWLRWFGALGSGWMIATGFIVLAAARRDGADPAPRIQLPRFLPAAAVLLAALMPLTDIASTRSLLYTLTSVVVIGASCFVVVTLLSFRGRTA